MNRSLVLGMLGCAMLVIALSELWITHHAPKRAEPNSHSQIFGGVVSFRANESPLDAPFDSAIGLEIDLSGDKLGDWIKRAMEQPAIHKADVVLMIDGKRTEMTLAEFKQRLTESCSTAQRDGGK